MSALASTIYDTLAIFGADDDRAVTTRFQPVQYTRDEERIVRLSGDERVYVRSHTMEVDVMDADFVAAVRRFQAMGLPARAVVRGADRHRLWLEPVVPQVLPLETGAVGAHGSRIRLFTAAPAAKVFEPVENLLARFNWHGGPGPFSGRDAFAGQDDDTFVTTGQGGFTVWQHAGSAAALTIDTPFPAGAARAAASMVIMQNDFSDPITRGDVARLRLRALASNGSTLSSNSVGIEGVTGLVSVTLEPPPYTYALRFEIELSHGSHDPCVLWAVRPTLTVGYVPAASTTPVPY